MSKPDVAVILLGLTCGFLLVNYFLSRSEGSKGGARGNDAGWRSSDRPEEQERPASRPDGPPWFDVLGVLPSASKLDIELAYRRQISQHHPDKVAQLGEDIRRLAETRAKAINRAYDEACAPYAEPDP